MTSPLFQQLLSLQQQSTPTSPSAVAPALIAPAVVIPDMILPQTLTESEESEQERDIRLEKAKDDYIVTGRGDEGENRLVTLNGKQYMNFGPRIRTADASVGGSLDILQGYELAPFAQFTIVHNGNILLPIEYVPQMENIIRAKVGGSITFFDQIAMNAIPLMLAAYTGGQSLGLAGGAEAGAAAGLGEPIGVNAYFAGSTPGLLSSFIPASVIDSAISGALQGGVSGLISGEDPLKGALTGGLTGGVTGGLAQVTKPFMPASPILSGAVRGATGGLLSSAARGEDPVRGLVRGGVTGGMFPALEAGVDEIIALSKAPVPVVSGGEVDLAQAELDAFMKSLSATIQAPPSEGMFPIALPAGLPSAKSDAATVEAATAPVAKPSVAKEIAQYSKLAFSVWNAYQAATGDKSGPIPQYRLPERREGQSDEEYGAEIAETLREYLGPEIDLSPEALRKAGVDPGTPQYLEYILTELDRIIERVFGADPEGFLAGESAEDLQAAMRGKTTEEAQMLARALYVRGALGGFSFKSQEVDPFTGVTEELGLLSGEKTSSPIAAWQRGLARFGEELAPTSGVDARSKIGERLGLRPDLFGLQRTADARKLRAMLAEMMEADETDEERKRRRGFRYEDVPFGEEDFWKSILESRDPRLLARWLEQLGGSEQQGSAVEQLFGWRK